MLEFKKEYFLEETRDDFVIAAFMKNAWAAKLELMCKFQQICQEHQLTYYAAWGTMLGAVRHKGFITWDDDIDIFMPRADFEKLKNEADLYAQGIELLDFYNTDELLGRSACISDVKKLDIHRNSLKENHGFPFYSTIDIFVLENFPSNREIIHQHYQQLNGIFTAYQVKRYMEENEIEVAELRKCEIEYVALLQQIQDIIGVTLEKPTSHDLYALLDQHAQKYQECEVAYVGDGKNLVEDFAWPKEWFEDVIWMDFENIKVPVPKGYHEFLSLCYGADYMVPQNKARGHGYPFYDFIFERLVEEKQFEEIEEAKAYYKKVAQDYYWKFLNKTVTTSLTYQEEELAGEELEGIEISSERKRIWAAQLEILEEIRRLCEKHQLKAYAIGETLEGARLRKDFLPENEDLQLGMLREDFEKLQKILEVELDPWFDYRSLQSHEMHYDTRVYVLSDGYLCDEKEYLQRFHGCPYQVGVEIIPLDYWSQENNQVKTVLINSIETIVENMDYYQANPEELVQIIGEIEKLLNIKIARTGDIKRELLQLLDMICSTYGEKNAEYVCEIVAYVKGNAPLISKKELEQYVETPFGKSKILAKE